MRILILTPYLPWPPNAGGKAAQLSTLAALAGDHDFHIVCPIYSAKELEYCNVLQNRLKQVTVHPVRLYAASSPINYHLLIILTLRKLKSLIQSLAYQSTKLFWKLVSCGGSISSRSKMLSSPLNDTPNAPFFPFRPLPESLIEATIKALKFKPDLIQIEFAEFLSILTVLPRDIPRLFIHHQLHWIYAERFVATVTDSPYSKYIAKLIKRYEFSLLSQCDAIITFSEIDREKILEQLTSVTVYTSPFPAPIESVSRNQVFSSFSGRFIFLGNSDHGPNIQGATWLLEVIWPLLESRNETWNLYIIGTWPQQLRSIYKSSKIHFTGYIEDIEPAIKDSIMLVPIKVGSGIRTKILTAMAHGVPVVSTYVGAEGISITPGADILIADNPTDFAEKAANLATNLDLYKQIAESAIKTYESKYSASKVRDTRNSIYREIVIKARRPNL
jgi:glycosyltransferase involved in cell wall biosynthesis